MHHKVSKRLRKDIPALIRAKVTDPDRVSFLHWLGEDYRATNQFKDVRNVILAGTLFYEFEHYEALGRLSRGTASHELFDKSHVKSVEAGEHAQLILQALCRASARKSVNEGCAECEAYIIAHPNSGIPKMLEDGTIFPGAKVLDWTPVRREPTGKVKDAVDYISSHLSENPTAKLRTKAVREKVGISDRSNWKKDIVGHRDFLPTLDEIGIKLENSKGRNGSYFYNEVK